MDPFSAFTSVVAVIELVGRVSISAASLMRDVKGARTDMIQVRKDLGGLSTVLKMVAEDLQVNNGRPDVPIASIAKSCLAVLSDIEAVLCEGRSRLAWATSRKDKVDGLRARLKEYTLWLDVALGYRTMVVVHAIKSDTALILGKVDNIERNHAVILRRMWAEITKPGVRATMRMWPPAQAAPGVSHSRQPQQLPWQGPSGAPGVSGLPKPTNHHGSQQPPPQRLPSQMPPSQRLPGAPGVGGLHAPQPTNHHGSLQPPPVAAGMNRPPIPTGHHGSQQPPPQRLPGAPGVGGLHAPQPTNHHGSQQPPSVSAGMNRPPLPTGHPGLQQPLRQRPPGTTGVGGLPIPTSHPDSQQALWQRPSGRTGVGRLPIPTGHPGWQPPQSFNTS